MLSLDIYLNIQISLNNNVVLLGWSDKQRCNKNNAINKNIYLKIKLIIFLGAVQVSRYHFGGEGGWGICTQYNWQGV